MKTRIWCKDCQRWHSKRSAQHIAPKGHFVPKPQEPEGGETP